MLHHAAPAVAPLRCPNFAWREFLTLAKAPFPGNGLRSTAHESGRRQWRLLGWDFVLKGAPVAALALVRTRPRSRWTAIPLWRHPAFAGAILF